MELSPVQKLLQPWRCRPCVLAFSRPALPSFALKRKAPLPTASLNEKQLISKLRNLIVIQGSAWFYHLKK
jgi:hypothetical protein